jgi:hypothetical protein
MEHNWLRPEPEWSLRTWVILALLCTLPLGLTVVLFTVGNH